MVVNMNELINKIGERITAKMRVVNIGKLNGYYKENFREYPAYSEFVGMTQMLRAMDIDFEIERIKTIMNNKQTVVNDNISVLEAYYTFLTKGTTYEINNGHVTSTYNNGNEQ